MKKFIYILAISLIFGCTTTKSLFERKSKTNTDRSIKEVETKRLVRAGDTVTINIPNIRYKDTTITRTNTVTNTLANVTYDKYGNQRFDCISSEILELTKIIRNIEEQKKEDVKEREKEKKSIISGELLLYVFLGLGGLLILNKVANKFI